MDKKKFFNIDQNTLKVLVTPLDWGLGHTTRCIPIIKELLKQGCQVIVAGPESLKIALHQEFPDLKFLPLVGYQISLSRKPRWFLAKMVLQFPRIIHTLYYEHKWLKKIIKTENIDIVISDNRPGVYSNNITSIYITHQLSIKTNSRLGDYFSNKIHHHYIKKYTACWVPDSKENSLAGQLSHLSPLPLNVKYIGVLSRFEKVPSKTTGENYLVILLSGPEPQRTILEKQLLAQLNQIENQVLFVRGTLTNDAPVLPRLKNVIIKNYLNSENLNSALNSASLIISRSGYTSIMDYVALQKRAVLIATPGQAEQEYLAGYLSDKKYFLGVSQQIFELKKAVEQGKNSEYTPPSFQMDEYKKVIRELVTTHKSKNFAPQV